MKFWSVFATVFALSLPIQAAPTTNFGLKTPRHDGLQLQRQIDSYSDMATVDRLISDREYAKAIPVLDNFLEGSALTDRERSIGHSLRGLALHMVGRFKEAIDDFSMSLHIQERSNLIDPNQWKTIFNRGIAHEAAQNLSSAADDFVRAYAIAPNERRVIQKILTFFNKE